MQPLRKKSFVSAGIYLYYLFGFIFLALLMTAACILWLSTHDTFVCFELIMKSESHTASRYNATTNNIQLFEFCCILLVCCLISVQNMYVRSFFCVFVELRNGKFTMPINKAPHNTYSHLLVHI